MKGLTTEDTEGTERATPETDDQPTINAINDNGYQVPCVDIEFARKLERERDEARAEVEKLRESFRSLLNPQCGVEGAPK